MTFLIYRIDLLQSAVAASHSCCHYYQNRLFHNLVPPAILEIQGFFPYIVRAGQILIRPAFEPCSIILHFPGKSY